MAESANSTISRASTSAVAAPRPLRPRLGAGERGVRLLFLLCAALALGFMLLIMIFLFQTGWGLFRPNEEGPGIGLSDFLFNTAWYPTYDSPDFGILALMAGSLAVTCLSAFLSIPLGLGLAVYLSQVAGPRLREVVKPAVELLAAIPSVVLGFVGLAIIAPFMQAVLDLPPG